MSTEPQSVSEMANPFAGKPSPQSKPALKVWSYDVPAAAKNLGFKQRMPVGARLLGVRRGSYSAQIFALVNPELPEEERLFWVAQTNYPLPEPPPGCTALAYVGTWESYAQVWHLFELASFQPSSEGNYVREPGEEG